MGNYACNVLPSSKAMAHWSCRNGAMNVWCRDAPFDAVPADLAQTLAASTTLNPKEVPSPGTPFVAGNAQPPTEAAWQRYKWWEWFHKAAAGRPVTMLEKAATGLARVPALLYLSCDSKCLFFVPRATEDATGVTVKVSAIILICLAKAYLPVYKDLFSVLRLCDCERAVLLRCELEEPPPGAQHAGARGIVFVDAAEDTSDNFTTVLIEIWLERIGRPDWALKSPNADD
eukprot:NODE_15975_length_1019_cov_2.674888.p1 GENE.NODE_15975_length_1019_cov_2.674888~~NODE_15975_length_1019_cov_2.674888.p1  ORF type:complete len:230 (-),score=46.75 NODE_15975_length_1019_cov_2.674888:257-946(-)